MILSSLEKFRDFGLLMMRTGLGIMFILHGHPKLFGGKAVWASVGKAVIHFGIEKAPAVWGFIMSASEFGGGILLIIGLFTRPSCIMLALTMIITAKMQFVQGNGLMAASHAIELAVVFLSLVIIGPGKFSVDKK